MTAVEWLVQRYNDSLLKDNFISPEEFQRAKEMEKQQITDAFNNGFSTTQWDKIKENKAEQYYNETFNN
jgi:hypothetical protein